MRLVDAHGSHAPFLLVAAVLAGYALLVRDSPQRQRPDGTAVYGTEHSYAIGLMLLSDVALAAAVYTGVKMRALARQTS